MYKKILIADDHALMREIIRSALEVESKDYEIHEAKDGNEAELKAKAMKPDLLILDVLMPGQSGYEVCQHLKSNPDTRDIYVLYLTAQKSQFTERSAELSGGDDFMNKPFSLKELRYKVRKGLGMTDAVGPQIAQAV